MSVHGEDARGALTHDGPISHLFECGLTLAALFGHAEVTKDVAHRLVDVIEELDHAVAVLRSAALARVGFDRDASQAPSCRGPSGASDPIAASPAASTGERRRLYRVGDDVFAYAMRGHDFFRASDHMLWAHESEDLLLSARSGSAFARRVGDVFHDLESHAALYYLSGHVGSLPDHSLQAFAGADRCSVQRPPTDRDVGE